jgi:ParB family chromosome partitioning protein
MALGKGLQSLIREPKAMPARPFVAGGASIDSSANVAPKPELVKAPRGEHEVIYIPLTQIVPNREQPRKHFEREDLDNLVASIKEHGILQPITVSEKTDGGYELIAGERRFRASQIAGLATVPALVRKTKDDAERLELALIENIQRQDLNSIEEAFAYERLMDEFGLTQEEVSKKVGKSRSAVANTVRLLDLPEDMKQALMDGRITAGKARALLSLSDPEAQREMFQSLLGEKMSVREVEARVAAKGEMSRKGSVRRDPNVVAQEKLIEERLGTKVHITKKGERGTIVIDYYSLEELKRLLTELT